MFYMLIDKVLINLVILKYLAQLIPTLLCHPLWNLFVRVLLDHQQVFRIVMSREEQFAGE